MYLSNLWFAYQDLHTKLEVGNLNAEEVKKAKHAQKLEFPKGIPACGADALHFTLCSYNYKGNHITRSCLQTWDGCISNVSG